MTIFWTKEYLHYKLATVLEPVHKKTALLSKNQNEKIA